MPRGPAVWETEPERNDAGRSVSAPIWPYCTLKRTILGNGREDALRHKTDKASVRVRSLSRATGGNPSNGGSTMQLSHQFRAGLVALIAIVGASFASAAYADSGTIYLTVIQGGWIIGGSGGSGTLTFHG